MKKITAILLAVMMILSCLLVVACRVNPVYYDVIVHPLNGEAAHHIKFDENFTFPPAPTYEGYTFGGWYGDPQCENPWKLPAELTEDVHIYAKWTPADTTVSVTFNYNYSGSTPTVVSVAKGQTVTLPQTPTRSGYTFGGWYTDTQCTSAWSPSAITQDVQVYAKWTAVSGTDAPEYVDVTFNYNMDGVTPEVVSVVKGQSVTLPQTPTRSGYTFEGWYRDSNGTLTWDSSAAVNSPLTVYAKWKAVSNPTPDMVIVTFDYNYSGTSYSQKTINKGSSVDFPTNPTRSGYTFEGWFTQATGGTKWIESTSVSQSMTLYAHWTVVSSTTHTTHDFGDNYFMYVKCSGCDEIGRNASTNSFKNDFKYTFTASRKTSINNMYTALVNAINAGTAACSSIEDQFGSFRDELDYVNYQYDVAYVLYSAYCTEEGDQYDNALNDVQEYYNTLVANYYTLFKLIDNSKYGSQFFADAQISADEKAELLAMADSYADGGDNSNEADRLANEYNTLLSTYENNSSTANLNAVYSKFGAYVNANNTIAKQFGYDNYMDYAYANVYYREYTPAQVAQMRNKVKTYIAPVLKQLYTSLQNIDNSNITEKDRAFYFGLKADSLFTIDSSSAQETYDAINLIGNYFKYLTSTTAGKQEINFYKHANELFKNGNYYTGQEEGAYTAWIEQQNKSVLYFDDTADSDGYYYYSTAFTFVHEFGHYYNGIYNGSMSLSMDHDETQSQGDEMLFLAWLKDNLPSGVSAGYNIVAIEQLADMMMTIIQSTAVDEFEQAVYNNSYGDGEFKNGIDPSRYGDLYSTILNSYGDGISDILNSPTYWMYVCVDSSAYYISYAMSALPSLELYVKAMNDGLNSARDSYFKLFTFSDNTNTVDKDNDGDVTYSEVLSYAGLANPFDDALYTSIAEYFAN